MKPRRFFSCVVLTVALTVSPVSGGPRPSRQETVKTDAVTTIDVAFEHARGSRGEVWYVATGRARATRVGVGFLPVVSENRAELFFWRAAGKEENALIRYSVETGREEALIRLRAAIQSMRRSPTGDDLVVALFDRNRDRLVTIDPKRRTVTEVTPDTPDGTMIFNPAWWSDGDSIVFHDMDTLYRIGRDGTVRSKTLLREITGQDFSVTSSCAFSPSPTDPTSIAFTRSVPGTAFFEKVFGEPNTALFIYSTDTRQRRRLTSATMVVGDFVWARDGKTVYFSGYDERTYRSLNPFRIFRISATGNTLIEIARGDRPAN